MKKHEKGQGLVEYALILVLVAIVVIIINSVLGPAIANVFDEVLEPLDPPGPGSKDPSASPADIVTSAEQTTLELADVLEIIEVLKEEAVAQEEGLKEGVDFNREAAVEGLEVLIDYADDSNKQALSEALSQLMQDVKDGNGDAVLEAINSVATDLAEAPLEVAIAMSLKMAPRLIDSLAAVSSATVSPDTIAAAQQALEQLDPDHPGKTEAQQHLQVGINIMEERFLAGEMVAEADCAALGTIITLLESAGEEDWAVQFAADSEVCGY